MPLHWHVNLPGPLAYSKPVRRRGKKPGCLTAVLTWFIVKPFELMFVGLAKLFSVRSRSNTERPVQKLPHGWYSSPGGWVYWNGQTWYDMNGRTIL